MVHQNTQNDQIDIGLGGSEPPVFIKIARLFGGFVTLLVTMTGAWNVLAAVNQPLATTLEHVAVEIVAFPIDLVIEGINYIREAYGIPYHVIGTNHVSRGHDQTSLPPTTVQTGAQGFVYYEVSVSGEPTTDGPFELASRSGPLPDFMQLIAGDILRAVGTANLRSNPTQHADPAAIIPSGTCLALTEKPLRANAESVTKARSGGWVAVRISPCP